MQLHLDLFGIEPLNHFAIRNHDVHKEKQLTLTDDKNDEYRVIVRRVESYESSESK